jgi:predicted nucleotidyltransferase
MIDLTRVDKRLYDVITPVVEDLTSQVGVDPDSILLVGAGCRDVLHAAFGHTFPARATTDTDLGIAVSDWSVSERIEAKFPRIGSNGIRYQIAGVAVDIMPFGEVEDPEGISRPVTRSEELVVFGFQDVYDRALPLTLPNGQTIRLPQPAGYVALKMRSWIDRAAYYEDKDAKDLALATFWYQNAPETQERLYDSDEGFAILSDLDLDTDAAAVRLLGMDAVAQLSPSNRDDLARRWVECDLEDLARDFTLPAGAPHSSDLARRRSFVGQLVPQVNRPTRDRGEDAER